MSIANSISRTLKRIPYYAYLVAPSSAFAVWNVVYLWQAHQTVALVSDLVKIVLLCASVWWLLAQTAPPSKDVGRWKTSLRGLALNSLMTISFLSDFTALQVFWKIPPEVARNYQHHQLARNFSTPINSNDIVTAATENAPVPPAVEAGPRALTRRELDDNPASPSVGSAAAQVTIVEFSDFQCPYCKRMSEALRRDISRRRLSNVRLVYKFYPLPTHDWATQASLASYCVSQTDRNAFWALNDYLFAHQPEITTTNLDAHLTDFFAHHPQVDASSIRTCMTTQTARDAILADIQLGRRIGVFGTPTVYIGGEKLVSTTSPEAALEMIHKLQQG